MNTKKNDPLLWIQKLIHWSKENFFSLPWRVERSPYRTLVSEFMLQQTTVNAVLTFYPKFMKCFPTLKSLAAATEEEVLQAWRGLGYYRRARYLYQTSREVKKSYGGDLPFHYEELRQCPGVGDYTAKAILSLGYGQHYLPIDTNVERVLSRLMGWEIEKKTILQKKIEAYSFQLPQKDVDLGSFAEALMDLGRTFCRVKDPGCQLCVMKEHCSAFQQEKTQNIPLHLHRKKNEIVTSKKMKDLILMRFFIWKKNHLLLVQKKKHQWLAGQWDVPSLLLREDQEEYSLGLQSQYHSVLWKLLDRHWPSWREKSYGEVSTTITHHRFKNILVKVSAKEWKEINQWLLVDDGEFVDLGKEDRPLVSHLVKFLKKINQVKA